MHPSEATIPMTSDGLGVSIYKHSTACSTVCSGWQKKIFKLYITRPLWIKSSSDQSVTWNFFRGLASSCWTGNEPAYLNEQSSPQRSLRCLAKEMELLVIAVHTHPPTHTCFKMTETFSHIITIYHTNRSALFVTSDKCHIWNIRRADYIPHIPMSEC